MGAQLDRMDRLEEQQRDLVNKLKELTQSGLLRWDHTVDFGPRAYCAEYNGVSLQLRVNNQTLLCDEYQFTDSQGLLDELAWAVEAQLRPVNHGTSRITTPRDVLQDVLDKLNAQ